MPGDPSHLADSKELASADIWNCFAFSLSNTRSGHVENYSCFIYTKYKYLLSHSLQIKPALNSIEMELHKEEDKIQPLGGTYVYIRAE